MLKLDFDVVLEMRCQLADCQSKGSFVYLQLTGGNTKITLDSLKT